MIRTIKSLGQYRGWRRIVTAGAMSFAATLAAVLIVDLVLVPISALSIVLAATVGGLVGFCWVGTVSAVRTVQAIGALNTRREVALDSMIQGLCVFDSQYRLVVWNDPYRVMYKLDARGLKRGVGLRDLLIARQAAGTFAGDVDEYMAALKDKIGQSKAFAVDIELPDGRTIAVVDTPTPDGGWIATHEDITERKRAERELDHTRAFLDTIVENVPSPIMVKAIPHLEYLLINRAAEDYLGIDRRELLGKTSGSVFAAETADMIETEDRRLIATGGSVFRDEHAVMTPGNGMRIVTSARLQVVGTDNKPQYLITVI
ncbi:MAG: hypothetical protein B7Y77_02980, partial [Bradyrhizobium sp. 35-63-5]